MHSRRRDHVASIRQSGPQHALAAHQQPIYVARSALLENSRPALALRPPTGRQDVVERAPWTMRLPKSSETRPYDERKLQLLAHIRDVFEGLHLPGTGKRNAHGREDNFP